MNRFAKYLLATAVVLITVSAVHAQLPRGVRSIVRGGMRQQVDSADRVADSLRMRLMMLDSSKLASLGAQIDQAIADSLPADSIVLPAQSLPTDSLIAALSALPADSLAAMMERLPADSTLTDSVASVKSAVIDTTSVKRRDSLTISKVSWISAVAPGFGQIYNKQYWKLPILYSTVGTGLALGLHENKLYKQYKKQVTAITNVDASRTPELDALQTQMIRHNTRRQIYLIGAIASYIYFIGDAAVNYKGDEVSRIKKATTLSMICPGAGQIYNGSYWKAPIVIGAFASMIYVIDWNNRGYQRFKTAYNLRVAYDNALSEYEKAENKDELTEPVPTDEFKGRYSATYLKNLKDNYRRSRDLSIIITAGVYLLNVIDAHVDAHLRDYDISDDLSMNLQPQVGSFYSARTGSVNTFGFGLSLTF